MIRSELQSRDSGALGSYLDEIRDDVLLSAGEEVELARAIARGDAEARARMIRANLRLVVRIARDYSDRGLSLEDLIGEGNLGLIRAVREFDPAFGTRFSTYASYWIKQSIRLALTNTATTIRLPSHMVVLLSKWRRAERVLGRELGRAPSGDEVARSLDLSDAQRVLVERARRASALRPEGSTGDEGWSGELSDPAELAPDALLLADDDRRDLHDRLGRLDDRERTILALRFGLEGDEPLTLKEVGDRLGMTREWVRKIERRAVRKLDGPAPAPAVPAAGTSARPRRGRRSAVAARSARPHAATPCLSLQLA